MRCLMKNIEIHEERGVEFLFSPLFSDFLFLRHAFSTRRGGMSKEPFRSLNLGPSEGEDPAHVKENRRRFFEASGMKPTKVVEVKQVHGAKVVNACDIPEDGVVAADGIVTNAPGIFAAVQTADCLPVLVADPVKCAVAAVHAGRRGLASGVLEAVVLRMKECFESDAENLVAVLGPAISGKCYEVGDECIPPFQQKYLQWRDFCIPIMGGKWFLDLPQVARSQLVSAGLSEERIGYTSYCTFSESARFFSYRRDGSPTGRLLSVIGIV